MKELWDLYGADRAPLGRAHVRGEALPEGCFHLVVQPCPRAASTWWSMCGYGTAGASI